MLPCIVPCFAGKGPARFDMWGGVPWMKELEPCFQAGARNGPELCWTDTRAAIKPWRIIKGSQGPPISNSR